jgi:uncharacterized membrane protein YeaQ/YmgE (transglycosylase-associated protein family)
MGIISWIVVGVVAGVIACYLSGRLTSRDYLANIAVGLVGAISGGFAANLVTRQPPLGVNSSSLFVALLGALVFLVFANAARRS